MQRGRRPPVSVVVPFYGGPAAAKALLENLGRLRVRPGDEIIIADNTGGAVREPEAAGAKAVAVTGGRSARRARNEGARHAAHRWLLFIDADCRPVPDLLDEYFSPGPAERCGVVAGEVVGNPDQNSRLARWARSRRGHMARHHLVSGPRPAGIAGNLLLRREAWEQLGGFEEGARSEADVDLCWRAQADGWALEYRPRALVFHHDPERLAAVARQAWMYGAGKRWLRRIWGAAAQPPRIASPLARSVGGAAVWLLTGRFERALFKLIDGLVALLAWLGYVTYGMRPR